jgi:prepilin-type N-terminal cleavage/methylation domain-containing protein
MDFNIKTGARAFTLIEMLVVIVLIAILAALLLPVLARAKNRANRIHCFNNERQLGIALSLYADANLDFLPAYGDYADWGGQTGTSSIGGGQTNLSSRLVNQYISDVDIFHCPADKGDALFSDYNSCWEDYGTSYLMTFHDDRYAVEHCGGDVRPEYADTQASIPIKQATIGTRPVTKIILGDWPWFGDRNINASQSAWHNDLGEPVFPMLFGDGHVQYYLFPNNRESYDGLVPDINAIWW